MSKAFTRESDDSGAGDIPFIRTQLPTGLRNYITREGAERLKQRLNDLLGTKQELATAESPSESEQRKIESAIRNLQHVLNSVIVAETPGDQDKIAFGAKVRLRYANGEEENYHIVGVEEADPEQGSISWISPLGRALLSHRAGDKVRFRSPAGEEELTILTICYTG